MQGIKVIKENKKLKVYSPHNSRLPEEARELGGKWDGEAWVYDPRNEEMVKDLYMVIYGQYDMPVDMVSIMITAHHDIEEETEPVHFGGRKIVAARGRDTGARTGDGVLFKSGRIGSGGSAKYWTTKIDKGSKFILHDVPYSMVKEFIENPKEGDEFKVKVLGPAIKTKEDLLKEKKALEKRLSEIEKELHG